MSARQNATAKERFFLALAYVFGVLATLCCLPALVFLLFGFSFGFLGAELLSPYRVPLSIVAVSFFVVYVWYFQKSCKKGACKKGAKSAVFQILCAVVLVFILFYPEILGWLYA